MAVLVAATGGACSSGASTVPDSKSPAGSPRVATDHPVNQPIGASFRVAHRLSLPISNPTVTHVALGSKWLVYSQAKSGVPQQFPNEVRAVDLTSKKTRLVARSAWPKGQSDWVLTDGDWVYWTDQSIAGADSPVGLHWRIDGRNLRTGRPVTVAKSAFDSPVPLPVAANGKVVWAQQARSGSTASVIQEYDENTSRTTKLATLPAGAAPDQLAIGRAGVYFDATAPTGTTSDVWRVGAPGKPAHRITTNGHARAVVADPASTVTAWSDTSGTSDPRSFTIARADVPRRVVRSGVEYDLHLGNGFASYISAAGVLTVTPIGSTTQRRIATALSIPCRTSVDTNRIAYCTQNDATGKISLKVDELVN